MRKCPNCKSCMYSFIDEYAVIYYCSLCNIFYKIEAKGILKKIHADNINETMKQIQIIFEDKL